MKLLTLLFAVLLWTVSAGVLGRPAKTNVWVSATPAVAATIHANLGKMPLSFEENRGQADSSVRFISRGKTHALFLSESSAVLAVGAEALRMKWVGANALPRLRGMETASTKSNYFRGSDPKRWVTGVSSYRQVDYSSVYPGVDLTFHSSAESELEYDWLVHPGTTPDVIRMSFEGAKRPRIDSSGNLVLEMRTGEVRQKKPFAYQETQGRRREIRCDYVLSASGDVGFRLGEYDHKEELVVDPAIVFASFVGGSGIYTNDMEPSYFDAGYGIALDPAGNVWIAGATFSTDLPVVNPLPSESTKKFFVEAFVSKLDPSGKQLLFSTYLGGSGGAVAAALAVDATGNAYVAGSAGVDFPTVNAAQAKTAAPLNVFVAKLNPSGTALLFSTYLGGSGDRSKGYFPGDGATTIVLDGSGNVRVGGFTTSSDFPVTAGAFLPKVTKNCPGSSRCDAGFLAAFTSTGTLAYSTYLAGSGFDSVESIAVDASGSWYVLGQTSSNDFPVTSGAFQTTLHMAAYGPCPPQDVLLCSDYFVTKLSPNGSSLIYSTFLGGGGFEGQSHAVDWLEGYSGLTPSGGLAVDSTGNAYIIGSTGSNDFPTTPGSFQPTRANADPTAIVAKLNSNGTGLIYSTYLTRGTTYGLTIALDSQNNATVGGFTYSLDFPLVQPFQGEHTCFNPSFFQGCTETGYLAKLNSQGSALIYSTYVGSTGNPQNYSVVYGGVNDRKGNVYITGTWGLPYAMPTAIRPPNVFPTAFVLKVAEDAAAPAFTSAGIVNGASFKGNQAFGGIATVFGTGLSGVKGIVTASSLPLPASLAGTQVFVDGIAAPLFAVANVNGLEQINYQAPLSDSQFYGSVVVSNNGLMSGIHRRSLANRASPGIFTSDGSRGIFLHADYTPVTDSNSAKRGEVILMYATGLGPYSPDPGDGRPASASPLSVNQYTTSVSVQGQPATVSFSGLAPGFVGLCQVNFQVPSNVNPGSLDVVLTVAYGPTNSNTVKMPVQ